MAEPPKALPVARIADRVGIDFLEPGLGRDLRASLRAGIDQRFVFNAPLSPLAIFRHSVATSIRNAEADGKHFALLQRFLLDGPRDERMAEELLARCLTDAETSAVIKFIFHSMVNRFQGELAELLAVGTLARLLSDLRRERHIPKGTRAYLGDTVRAPTRASQTKALGADFHLLDGSPESGRVRLVGIGEVKSYELPEKRRRAQMEKHIARARSGLIIRRARGQDQRVAVAEAGAPVLRIEVVPSSWDLPRTFRFNGEGDGRRLLVDPPVPPEKGDRLERLGEDAWRITLRWSHEALASAAYDLTLWVMGEVGASVYRDDPRPEWAEMSPEEMGRNATETMLHSAVFRAEKEWDRKRVTALYNAYGFGYALGANFVNRKGRREVMWPKDLDELLAGGMTKHGCRLR